MGTSWISRKGGILEKGVDLEKGGCMNPLTNYVRLAPHILLEKFHKFLSKVHMVQMVRFFTLKYYQQILITGNTG